MSKETEKIVQSINTLASKLNRIESNYAAIEKKLGELETHRKEHGVKSLKVDAQADSQEAGHGKIDYSSACLLDTSAIPPERRAWGGLIAQERNQC